MSFPRGHYHSWKVYKPFLILNIELYSQPPYVLSSVVSDLHQNITQTTCDVTIQKSQVTCQNFPCRLPYIFDEATKYEIVHSKKAGNNFCSPVKALSQIQTKQTHIHTRARTHKVPNGIYQSNYPCMISFVCLQCTYVVYHLYLLNKICLN